MPWTLRFIFSWMLLVCPALASPLSSFGYVSNGQNSPEGNMMPFVDVWQGRMHINGSGYFIQSGAAWVSGFYSQTDPEVNGVDVMAYPNVFRGGWAIPHAALDFDFSASLAEVRGHCLPQHHWLGHQDSLDLTTLIRFDGAVYHAAQYAESQISGADTTWHLPWMTMPLPWPPQPVAIVVEGVARVKGVVSGQVTLLAADSLFIMGDLITSDTVLSPCGGDPPGAETAFGCPPPGSPHRIGLIGEGDIIVAATLENGFADGMSNPSLDCGLVSDPVVSLCGQARRDVIITASVLALGCSFEVEFWKTTAWQAVPPPVMPQLDCPGNANAHVQVWDDVPGGPNPDCPGAPGGSDRRGTLWFCGSLAVRHPGYTIRNPPGMWGNVWLGYIYKARRFDPNLLDAAPPWWPEARWISGYAVDVLLETGAASACGSVEDVAAFAQEWNQGQVRLRLRSADMSDLDVRVLTRVNGVAVDSVVVEAGSEAFTWWSPGLDLSPWLGSPFELGLEVQQGEWVGNPPQWDRYDSWNEGGQECLWRLDPTAVDTPVAGTFQLSAASPNPFNPTSRLTVTLPQGAALILQLVDVQGRLVRQWEHHLPAGRHELEVDGAGLPSGLYLARVESALGTEVRKLLLVK